MLKKLLKLILPIFVLVLFVTNTSFGNNLSDNPHWEKKYITVFIPQGYLQSRNVTQAFQTWQNKSYGNLHFFFTYNPPADIEVTFITGQKGSDTPITNFNINISDNNIITKANLQILNNKIGEYSNKYFTAAMLHSVGHCLGLSDTNRLASGIMYSPVNESLVITKSDMRKLFSISHWNWKDKNLK